MLLQDKKGISAIIGYIILVSIVIAMSVLVYSFLKTYVPKDIPECPEGISIITKDLECLGTELNFTLKNNGRFDIDGYLIKATNSSDQEIAVLDLVPYYAYSSGGNEIISENIETGKESRTQKFDLDEFAEGKIYKIEIIPIRKGENEKSLVCNKARITEVIPSSCQTP